MFQSATKKDFFASEMRSAVTDRRGTFKLTNIARRIRTMDDRMHIPLYFYFLTKKRYCKLFDLEIWTTRRLYVATVFLPLAETKQSG